MEKLVRDNIEAERGRKQLSKEGLSRNLGITSRTYWNYITGGPIPSDKLVMMAEMFGCSTDYLLGLTKERTPACQRAEA